MRVTRSDILVRGLGNRCPNCGCGGTLFPKNAPFRLNHECPRCGLKLEREEGAFLGAVALNYGVTTVGFLVPIVLLCLFGAISGMTASVVAGVGAVAFPILFYRSSRSWWLMNYYLVFPGHLPANLRGLGEGEDENT